MTNQALTPNLQFNPALGTLTQVTINFTGNANFAGSVTNNGAGAATFRVTETSGIDLHDGAGNLLFFTPSAPLTGGGTAISGDLVGAQTYTNLGSGSMANFGPFTPSVTGSESLTSGAIFSEFAAGTSVPFQLDSLTGETVQGGGGNITSALTTQVGASVSVTFTYTPATPPGVPEPSCLALFGLGSGALFLVRRLRKARR